MSHTHRISWPDSVEWVKTKSLCLSASCFISYVTGCWLVRSSLVFFCLLKALLSDFDFEKRVWKMNYVLPQIYHIWVHIFNQTNHWHDRVLVFEVWITLTSVCVLSVFTRSFVQQSSLIYGQSWFSFMINMRSMTTLSSQWCLIRQMHGKKGCSKTLLLRWTEVFFTELSTSCVFCHLLYIYSVPPGCQRGAVL